MDDDTRDLPDRTEAVAAVRWLPTMGKVFAQEIVETLWKGGLDPDPVGALIRTSSGKEWDASLDRGVGALACVHALRMLRPDERPDSEKAGELPDLSTSEGVARHNAAVRTRTKQIEAAAKSMSRETCEGCVRLMSVGGVAANTLGAALSGRIGVEWEPSRDVAAGMLIYRIALERLDVYDPDFRPRPEPRLMFRSVADDGSGIDMQVHYLPLDGRYEIKVIRDGDERVESVAAVHRPTFGMDVDDRAVVMEAAERMATDIEKRQDTERGR